MSLTLSDVAKSPKNFTYHVQDIDKNKLTLRPLEPSDINLLTKFISKLSETTKKFYSYKDDPKMIAKEVCEAVNKYDKLRFVLIQKDDSIVGLFELSFDIPSSDTKRFKKYGVELKSKTDCRFGPVLVDHYQGKGIGSQILPIIKSVAKKFGQNRMILWGGVHTNNQQAISYYEKNNFTKVGSFKNRDNLSCFDMMLKL